MIDCYGSRFSIITYTKTASLYPVQLVNATAFTSLVGSVQQDIEKAFASGNTVFFLYILLSSNVIRNVRLFRKPFRNKSFSKSNYIKVYIN